MRKQVVAAVLLAVALMCVPPANAESAAVPGQAAASDNGAAQSAGSGSDEPALEQDRPIDTSLPIDQRSISTAIESFTPTEEISADNAVPFPVDI